MPEILQYDFMQRALAGGTLIGLLCPLIGTFLVLRGYALIGDGLGHVAFAGVGTAMLAGLYPPLLAGLFAVAAALGLERLRRRPGSRGEIGLALVFYAGIAVAVIAATLARSFNAGLLGFLFGSVVTIGAADLWAIGGLTLLVGGAVALLGPALFAVGIDEEAARVAGLPVDRLNDLLAVSAALTVVVGMQVVGVLLVAALIVVPVAAALPLARSFRQALLGAVALGVLSVWVGLGASFYLDLAPGATIVLAALALYVLTSSAGRLLRR
ncbi:MAG TPA: metal ABC transporter permease [Thermodesulfobacteriota bacterium]